MSQKYFIKFLAFAWTQILRILSLLFGNDNYFREIVFPNVPMKRNIN